MTTNLFEKLAQKNYEKEQAIIARRKTEQENFKICQQREEWENLYIGECAGIIYEYFIRYVFSEFLDFVISNNVLTGEIPGCLMFYYSNGETMVTLPAPTVYLKYQSTVGYNNYKGTITYNSLKDVLNNFPQFGLIPTSEEQNAILRKNFASFLKEYQIGEYEYGFSQEDVCCFRFTAPIHTIIEAFYMELQRFDYYVEDDKTKEETEEIINRICNGKIGR